VGPEPGALSLLPPLLAIGLALAFRQVVLALLAGVWVGAWLHAGGDPLSALLHGASGHVVDAVADRDHATILVFTLLLGGMVGVLTRSGGGAGLAALATRRATSPRSGQLATWGLGIAVFFDDYANALLVGSSMRPVTDRLRVSREKLAFLVDATAAPVSSLALVSSWVGVEIGYIADQYERIGVDADPYAVFLRTIPYRFYPLLMLFFGLVLVLSKRDFGPMARAEARARKTGALLAPGARPASEFAAAAEDVRPRAANALVPLGALVAAAVAGFALAGDSLLALLWGSVAGCTAAVLSATALRSLSLAEALDAWLGGLQAMLLGAVILVLAWSLGAVCDAVGTAPYLVDLIGEGIAPGLLPAAVLLVSAAVSFATGTSWGTMAILFPLVVPLAHELAPGSETVLLGSVSSILAGSVWGDHCSPISDTTVLSSLAASCDHVDHVRTQLPYALAVGGVALLFGELPVGLGLYGPWVGLALGAGAVLGLVAALGRRPA